MMSGRRREAVICKFFWHSYFGVNSSKSGIKKKHQTTLTYFKDQCLDSLLNSHKILSVSNVKLFYFNPVDKAKSPGVDPKQLAAELQKVSLQQSPLVASSAVEKGSHAHSGTTSATSSAVPSPGQPGSPSVSKKRHSSKVRHFHFCFSSHFSSD